MQRVAPRGPADGIGRLVDMLAHAVVLAPLLGGQEVGGLTICRGDGHRLSVGIIDFGRGAGWRVGLHRDLFVELSHGYRTRPGRRTSRSTNSRTIAPKVAPIRLPKKP